MKIKVMYQSRGGNTAKIAQAIAQSVGASAEIIPPGYPFDKTDILFIGGGCYGSKLDKTLSAYINTLDPKKAKAVAVFGTVGGGPKYLDLMKTTLKNRGINVLDESFVCKGKFFAFFNRKHPDANDIANASKFAKDVISKLTVAN